MSFNIKKQYLYHLLYEVTNKVNGKKYVGIHSTNDINDNYFGSGIYIKNALEKYGTENFERKIIKLCKSREELLDEEKRTVTASMVKSEDYYNLSLGGSSFIDSIQKLDNNEFVRHQRKAGKIGGRNFYDSMSEEQKKEWHKKGRAKSSGTKGKTLKIKNVEEYSESRKIGASKRKRYDCPICKKEKMDAGNMKNHLLKTHKLSETEYQKIKQNLD
jgi:hypothetical protein